MSIACKLVGYPRDSFYRFKDLYEKGGELALQDAIHELCDAVVLYRERIEKVRKDKCVRARVRRAENPVRILPVRA